MSGGVLDAHARPVSVGQPEGTGTDAVYVVVEDVVPLSGHFVDPVDVHRAQQVVLIHGEVHRLPVDLSGTGEDNLQTRIVLPACLKYGKVGIGR